MNHTIGSLWRRWDLHFHTPRSHDYLAKDLTPKHIVDALIKEQVDVVAVTDHHVLDPGWIRRLRAEVGERHLTILPGVELTSTLGGSEGVHLIGLFSEDANLDYISAEIASRTGLSALREQGTKEHNLYVDFFDAAKTIKDLGGIVSIHGHSKANSIEGIANRPMVKQELKKVMLRDHVHLIEIGKAERQEDYRKIVFPSLGFELPIIAGSDNHDASAYRATTRCWIKADPTFRGLQMALREPRSRFLLGDKPPEWERHDQNRTKYIKAITFRSTVGLPQSDKWLQGTIEFNPGLVAIIGNKGSGKSALADCIGLLGRVANTGSFSFLHKDRFLNPKTGRGQHVEATLCWYSGEEEKRLLNDMTSLEEVERVKYLPQNYVELICNELSAPGGGGSSFERELKKVIFSHVPAAERLTKTSLDDLIQFKTQELRKKASILIGSLQEVSVRRCRLEEKMLPAARRLLENRIAQRQAEIQSHDESKPHEVTKPGLDAESVAGIELKLQGVEILKTKRNEAEKAVKEVESTSALEKLRAARARKLLDKLDNIETAISQQIEGLNPEANEIGLKPSELVSVHINREPVSAISKEANARIEEASVKLNADQPDGLKTSLLEAERLLKEAQDSLDLPNREYQAYLESLATWSARRKVLVGDTGAPDSSEGLLAELAELDKLPAQVTSLLETQESLAKQVHLLCLNEADVLRTFYEPVQDFITNHELAEDHIRLEFQVDVVEDGFIEGLLSYLNRNRKGSFYGNDEGREVAKSLVEKVDWASWTAVEQFLRSILDHLHCDKRGGGSTPIHLQDVMVRGKSVTELYGWLYGLSYLKPRYLLRWEGKELTELSPGERGTLLLAFYLLIDDTDVPLIIDQPEANLDNGTVARKLVHCIRAARERRQVLIVTHNPNLAVVCDADQVIYASHDISDGNKISYIGGSLENPEINRLVVEVLEGSRPAFDKRDRTYRVAGS